MATGSWSGALAREVLARPALVTYVLDGHRVAAPEGVALEGLERAVQELRWEGCATRTCLGQRRSAFVAHLPGVGAVVIKEYLRGGLVRHLMTHTHLWRLRTRPERELRMLVLAAAAGARVPEPVATVARGGWLYRGWLITRLVPHARPLVDCVTDATHSIDALVGDVARQIERLIQSRVLHVDLHPGNVVVDGNNRAWLLDFDRALIFRGPPACMRWLYRARWRRAMKKHSLPAPLARVPALVRAS